MVDPEADVLHSLRTYEARQAVGAPRCVSLPSMALDVVAADQQVAYLVCSGHDEESQMIFFSLRLCTFSSTLFPKVSLPVFLSSVSQVEGMIC